MESSINDQLLGRARSCAVPRFPFAKPDAAYFSETVLLPVLDFGYVG